MPLLIASVAFLVAYSIQVLAEPSGAPATATGVVIGVTWAVFVADFLVRLAAADRRPRWLLHHLPDLAALLLPFLRTLQLSRLLTLLRLLNRSGGNALRERTSVYVLATAAILTYVGALAGRQLTRHSGAMSPRSRRRFAASPSGPSAPVDGARLARLDPTLP